MGRRYRRKTNGEIVLIFVAIVFALYFVIAVARALVEFFINNVWIIYSVAGFLATIGIAKLGYSIYLNHKHKNTAYYRETGLSRNTLKEPGKMFESVVFNEFKMIYPNERFILNGLFPKRNSINELFEVDLLLFSNKGIFCLEIKDWNGMVYGDVEAKEWSIGYGESIQRQVVKGYNPILQNKKHIIELNKHFEFDYISYVIFSSRSKIGEGFECVGYLKDFINYHDSLPIVFELDEVRACYEYFKEIADKKPYHMRDHIERLKYNESYHK